MTVVEHRSGPNWCGLFVSLGLLVGLAFGIHRLSKGPRRAEVVHTETRHGWTGRVTRIGYWSEKTQTWTGKSTYEIELVGPDNGLERISTNIDNLDRALEHMRFEIAKRVSSPSEADSENVA